MSANPFLRGFDIFNRALTDRGLARGLTAKKKDDRGEIAIRDTIGADAWTGAGITADGIAAELKNLPATLRADVGRLDKREKLKGPGWPRMRGVRFL